MSFKFDATEGLIFISAELFGPSGTGTLRLALDTGATTTVINTVQLMAVGYDPTAAANNVEVTTGGAQSKL